ncbi:hypothetical protein AB6C40_24640, partial [Vibrio splendidus]
NRIKRTQCSIKGIKELECRLGHKSYPYKYKKAVDENINGLGNSAIGLLRNSYTKTAVNKVFTATT